MMQEMSSTRTTPGEPGATHPVPSEAELREVAIGRLKKKSGFRSHLLVYILVNVGLWALWIVDGVSGGWEFPWPVFPTILWGLFVSGQANDLYRRDPMREDLVQREVDKLRAGSKVQPLDIHDQDDDGR